MTTPARKQYLDIKTQHSEEILLFRMGDFYETFDDDALIISRDLDIALTSREMGKGERIPLAGIPYHALDTYLVKLIAKGHKVAICEQIENRYQSTDKSIKEREVVRIVTPGTITEDSLLEENSNSFLASVVVEDNKAGIAYVDISTSEFAATQVPLTSLKEEVNRLTPREIIIGRKWVDKVEELPGSTITIVDERSYHHSASTKKLLEHFGSSTLEPYGCESLPLATRAAGSIISYIEKNQRQALSNIRNLQTYSINSYMQLDPQTIGNLELFGGGRWGTKNSSLFTILDKTFTAMGSRLLKKWIARPLIDINDLTLRQNVVEWFTKNSSTRRDIKDLLQSITDLERLSIKIRNRIAAPRDLTSIGGTLEVVPAIRNILSNSTNSYVSTIGKNFAETTTTCDLIKASINKAASIHIGDGKTIKHGFSLQLDKLKNEISSAKTSLSYIETRERENTGIKSLKVGYNKVFGYYIEVSNPNLHLVPEKYVRRQTLVGGERYITTEMKNLESVIFSAQEKIEDLEKTLFKQVCHQIEQDIDNIIDTARAIALVDVFQSFGNVAVEYNYVKPTLSMADNITIEEGRHPIIERNLGSESFVSNNTTIGFSDNQLNVITGPNMSGKSTYLRQVALITLMAQIGSYVPAQKADISIVDRIFTRVGLQDDLTMGQSTFMVEMIETAYILHQATSRSLVILDEIGRGTSTYDGLAIAKAVVEFIHGHPRLGCKTLFATHYHELTELETTLPGVKNLTVSVIEHDGDVTFMRRIIPGSASRSYGIHVARLAGLPQTVLNRASTILSELEADQNAQKHLSPHSHVQLSLLKPDNTLLDAIQSLDITTMTPIEAITKLFELQNMANSHNTS